VENVFTGLSGQLHKSFRLLCLGIICVNEKHQQLVIILYLEYIGINNINTYILIHTKTRVELFMRLP